MMPAAPMISRFADDVLLRRMTQTPHYCGLTEQRHYAVGASFMCLFAALFEFFCPKIFQIFFTEKVEWGPNVVLAEELQEAYSAETDRFIEEGRIISATLGEELQEYEKACR